jgi:mono/diheme cytochrome c family protein
MKKNIIFFLSLSLLSIAMLVNCGKKEEKVEETTSAQAANSVNAVELYATCAACHGDTGEGNGAAAAALNPKPRNFKSPESEWKNGKTVAGITKTLKEGIAPGMASYSYMKEEEIAALASYVIELGSK